MNCAEQRWQRSCVSTTGSPQSIQTCWSSCIGISRALTRTSTCRLSMRPAVICHRLGSSTHRLISGYWVNIISDMSSTKNFEHLARPEGVRSRAKHLARDHRLMRTRLVEMRREAGMTQKDVAALLGITPQAVSKFERYDADPQLSTLRRYANVVGAVIETSVKQDALKDRPVPVHSGA